MMKRTTLLPAVLAAGALASPAAVPGAETGPMGNVQTAVGKALDVSLEDLRAREAYLSARLAVNDPLTRGQDARDLNLVQTEIAWRAPSVPATEAPRTDNVPTLRETREPSTGFTKLEMALMAASAALAAAAAAAAFVAVRRELRFRQERRLRTEAQRALQDAEASLGKIKEELDDTKQHVAAIEAQAVACMAQAADFEDEIRKLSGELKNASHELKEANLELEKKGAEIVQISAQLQEKAREAERLAGQADASGMGALRGELEELTKRLNEAVAARQDAEKRAAVATDAYQTVKNRTSELEATIETMRASHDATVRDLEGKISTERAEKNAAVARMENELQAASARYDGHLKALQGTSESQQRDAQARIDGLAAAFEATHEDLARSQAALDQARRDLAANQAQHELGSARAQEAFNRTITEKEREIAQAKAEVKRLEEALESQRQLGLEQAAQTRAEMERVRQEYADALAKQDQEFGARIQELEREIAQLRAELAESAHENRRLEAEVERKQAEVERLLGIIEACRQEAEKIRHAAKEILVENENLKAENTHLEARNTKLATKEDVAGLVEDLKNTSQECRQIVQEAEKKQRSAEADLDTSLEKITALQQAAIDRVVHKGQEALTNIDSAAQTAADLVIAKILEEVSARVQEQATPREMRATLEKAIVQAAERFLRQREGQLAGELSATARDILAQVMGSAEMRATCERMVQETAKLSLEPVLGIIKDYLRARLDAYSTSLNATTRLVRRTQKNADVLIAKQALVDAALQALEKDGPIVMLSETRFAEALSSEALQGLAAGLGDEADATPAESGPSNPILAPDDIPDLKVPGVDTTAMTPRPKNTTPEGQDVLPQPEAASEASAESAPAPAPIADDDDFAPTAAAAATSETGTHPAIFDLLIDTGAWSNPSAKPATDALPAGAVRTDAQGRLPTPDEFPVAQIDPQSPAGRDAAKGGSERIEKPAGMAAENPVRTMHVATSQTKIATSVGGTVTIRIKEAFQGEDPAPANDFMEKLRADLSEISPNKDLMSILNDAIVAGVGLLPPFHAVTLTFGTNRIEVVRLDDENGEPQFAYRNHGGIFKMEAVANVATETKFYEKVEAPSTTDPRIIGNVLLRRIADFALARKAAGTGKGMEAIKNVIAQLGQAARAAQESAAKEPEIAAIDGLIGGETTTAETARGSTSVVVAIPDMDETETPRHPDGTVRIARGNTGVHAAITGPTMKQDERREISLAIENGQRILEILPNGKFFLNRIKTTIRKDKDGFRYDEGEKTQREDWYDATSADAHGLAKMILARAQDASTREYEKSGGKGSTHERTIDILTTTYTMIGKTALDRAVLTHKNVPSEASGTRVGHIRTLLRNVAREWAECSQRAIKLIENGVLPALPGSTRISVNLGTAAFDIYTHGNEPKRYRVVVRKQGGPVAGSAKDLSRRLSVTVPEWHSAPADEQAAEAWKTSWEKPALDARSTMMPIMEAIDNWHQAQRDSGIHPDLLGDQKSEVTIALLDAIHAAAAQHDTTFPDVIDRAMAKARFVLRPFARETNE